MGWFSKGDDFADWRDPKIKKTKSQSPQNSNDISWDNESPQTPSQTEDANPFGFFGNYNSTSSSTNSNENYNSSDDNPHEKKQKLSKRLLELTNKLEEVSNQIYHLEQRMEVIEKKLNVGRF